MKVQRVYIDTSVIGGCFDPEFSPWSNGLVRDFREGNFKAVVSSITEAEILDAPKQVKDVYREILQIGADVLSITQSAIALANAYRDRRILTPKFSNDGLHIALATVAEVDVLVSWNFKHIVHFEKIRLFNAVNLEHGHKQIQIFSPREVTHYEER